MSKSQAGAGGLDPWVFEIAPLEGDVLCAAYRDVFVQFADRLEHEAQKRKAQPQRQRIATEAGEKFKRTAEQAEEFGCVSPENAQRLREAFDRALKAWAFPKRTESLDRPLSEYESTIDAVFNGI